MLDRVRLVIGPKFAITGKQLMHWLAYSLGKRLAYRSRKTVAAGGIEADQDSAMPQITPRC